jgi:hypothetical protein
MDLYLVFKKYEQIATIVESEISLDMKVNYYIENYFKVYPDLEKIQIRDLPSDFSKYIVRKKNKL